MIQNHGRHPISIGYRELGCQTSFKHLLMDSRTQYEQRGSISHRGGFSISDARFFDFRIFRYPGSTKIQNPKIWYRKSKIPIDEKSSRAARIVSGSPLEGVWSSSDYPALDIESRWDADFDFGSPKSQKSPKSDTGFWGFLRFWRSKIMVAIPSGLDIKSRAARRASDTF